MKCIATFLLLSLLSVSGSLGDVAVVTAQNGYLFDASGRVTQTAGRYDSFPILGRTEDSYRIELPSGDEARLRFVQSHSMVDHWKLNPKKLATAQQILGLIQSSTQNDSFERRDGKIVLASNIAQAEFTDEPLFVAWVRAAETLLAGDTGKAQKQIEEAQKTAAQDIKRGTGVLAAEIHNVEALIDQRTGRSEAAKAKFQKAIDITERTLNTSKHQDIVVYLTNRVSGLDPKTEAAAMVRDAGAASEIVMEVLPPTAIEVPRTAIVLGNAYLHAGNISKAIGTLTSAFGLLRTHHIDRKVDLALCQFHLGEAWRQRVQYVEAERWFTRADTRTDRDTSDEDRARLVTLQKKIQHSLGNIDSDRKDDTAALAHYMNAVGLIDDDNVETLDARSYVFAANTLTKLGRTEQARSFYRKAWQTFAQTDGPNSKVALDAKQSFVDAGGVIGNEQEAMTKEVNTDVARSHLKAPAGRPNSPETGSLNSDIALQPAYIMAVRPDERMLVTKTRTRIMSGSDVLARVPQGTRLYSLEQQGDWHKVVIPGKGQRAWVSKNDVIDELAQQAQNLSTEIKQRTGDPQTSARISNQILELGDKYRWTLTTQGPDVAAKIQEQIAGLLKESPGPEHFMTVQGQSSLASYYMSSGQYVKSRKLIDASMPAMRNVYGSDHPLIAAQLVRLARLLEMIGDQPGRNKCLREALQIATRMFGPDANRTIGVQLTLAESLTKSGQFAEAVRLFNGILEFASDGNHPLPAAAARAGLGEMRINQGKFAEAIPILQQADEEFASLGEGMRFRRGIVVAALASARLNEGNIQAATSELRRASRLLKFDDEIPLPTKVKLLGVWSAVMGERGDWLQSQRLASEALDLATGLYGKDTNFSAGPLNAQGRALAHQARFDEAVGSLDLSQRLVFAHLHNTIADLPVVQQIAYIRSNANPLLDVALSVGLAGRHNQKLVKTSETWLLNSKNIANELAARDTQVRRLMTADFQVKHYERWLDGRRRVSTLPPLTDEEARNEYVRDTKRRLTKVMVESFARLPNDVMKYLHGRRGVWLTCEEVQSKLAAGEVFIDFAVMRKDSFEADAEGPRKKVFAAWIIPASGAGEPQIVELGDADDIEKNVIQPYLKGVRSTGLKIQELGEDGALAELAAVNQALTKSVWLPLAAKLPAGTTHLTLCPDGALWQIPWAAIEEVDRKLLLEKYTIRFVSSGRDLIRETEQVTDLRPPLVIADPDYGAESDAIQEKLDELPLRSLSIRVQNVDASLLKAVLPDEVDRLEGTATEAVALEPLLTAHSGMKTEVYMRAAASEMSLRLTQRPHTLFIGTHGFFLPEEDLPESHSSLTSLTAATAGLSAERLNPLRRCGLLLAGCNNTPAILSSDQLDGIITGAEIVGLDLRGTKLVVLSACETGVGDLTSGQGVSGLRQAIQLAGAESVMSTLWEIPDRETAELMKILFQHIADGKNRAEALRLAQLERIEARRNRNGAAHPLYWAAFTVTGQN